MKERYVPNSTEKLLPWKEGIFFILGYFLRAKIVKFLSLFWEQKKKLIMTKKIIDCEIRQFSSLQWSGRVYCYKENNVNIT